MLPPRAIAHPFPHPFPTLKARLAALRLREKISSLRVFKPKLIKGVRI